MKKLNISVSKNKKVEKQIIDVLPEPEEKIVNAVNTEPDLKKKKFKISKKLIIILIILIVFGGLAAFAYYRFTSYGVRVQSYDEQGNLINACTNILNPECWTEAFRPQLKQTNGYTSALILGLDTRPNGSLLNTDSIIIASYNHSTNKTMLISIPRDFFSYRYKVKISAVYAYTRNKDKEDPFRYLKEEIYAITGLQINYVVRVYLDGVTNLVDNIGGVEICPYADFTAKYPNPSPKGAYDQWIYYDFKKGCQEVNGEKALVYARFRSIRRGPGELASDFSRVKRQQEIIVAVKNKILGQGLSLKEMTENYWSILQNLDEFIKFDFTFEDFLAGLALLDTVDKNPANVYLDPYFGGLYKLIYENTNAENGYTERAKDQTYGAIKKELTNIWNNIDFYKESPKIAVRNLTGSNLPSDHVVYSIKNNYKYWNRFDVYNDGPTDKFTGIKIFDFTNGTKPGSLLIIKTVLGVDTVELTPETYGLSRSDKNEDFLIAIGPSAATPTPVPTTN